MKITVYHGGTERVVALQHLAQHQPNNQICMLNQE